MSSSETLCFVRHLGLLIGKLVPEDLDIWNVWKLLREILDIVCSPSILFCEHIRLRIVIEVHVKSIKPKHHFLLHYSQVMEQSGPLVHIWSMKYEQFHRRSKLTSNVSGSFKNILQTLAHKSQLKFCHQIITPLKDSCQYNNELQISDDDYSKYFTSKCRSSLFQVKRVSVDSISYKTNMVVVTDALNRLPNFGIIKKFFVYSPNCVYFVCRNYIVFVSVLTTTVMRYKITSKKFLLTKKLYIHYRQDC